MSAPTWLENDTWRNYSSWVHRPSIRHILAPWVQDEDKIILLYGDIARDIRSLHSFLRFLVASIPSAETALHVSPVLMVSSKIKQRMEQGYSKKRK